MKKMMHTVLPSSNARYLLTKLIIVEGSDRKMLLNHSFTMDTHRNSELWNSRNFRNLFFSIDK